jgi:methyl acetate hydrolase
MARRSTFAVPCARKLGDYSRKSQGGFFEMTSDAASRKGEIDAALRRAADVGDVPGVVAMATDRNSVIYQGAFGKRVLGQTAPMTADTVVWIASMTKAITAAGAMQLVEQGKLDLDAPAAKVVPDIASAQVLVGFDADGQPRTRPPKSPITLRHLLTHTAGFGYEMWSVDIGKYQAAKSIPGIITCQNAALRTPLLFDPGERWFYGIGIDWTGKMVEAVSGKRLGSYLQQSLLAPLDMTSTAFKITPAMRERLAKIHQRGDDDKLTPQMELELPQEPEFEMGGGGLYSTAGDYLKFMRMILNRGKSDTTLPDQHPEGADGSSSGRPHVGGLGQLVFLDRSDHRHRRRVPDASPPVRRQEVASALLRLRVGVLFVSTQSRRFCATPFPSGPGATADVVGALLAHVLLTQLGHCSLRSQRRAGDRPRPHESGQPSLASAGLDHRT